MSNKHRLVTKMHIGILTSHPIQYHSPLFRGLARKFDIHVFFAHEQSGKEQSEAGFGVVFDWDIDLLEGYSYEFLRNVSSKPGVNNYAGCDTPEIDEKIKFGGFDLFIVTGWYLRSYWQAVRACRKYGIPVCTRGDSQLETPRSSLIKIGKEITYRVLLSRFDGFLSVGQKNREYLLHYGVPEEKIFFCPHFIDSKWFSKLASDSDKTKTLTSLGCELKKYTVLFVGKFIDVKKPVDLILALAELKRTHGELEIQAVYVGAGELEQSIRAAAADSDVTFICAGFQNQTALPAIYNAADLLVLPSKSETWGLVVNEAMACGTPVVVSSAVGCGVDLIEPGNTGEIYPVGDIPSLANAISQTLTVSQCLETKCSLKGKTLEYSLENAIEGVQNAAISLSKPNNETSWLD